MNRTYMMSFFIAFLVIFTHEKGYAMKFELTSMAFQEGKAIPKKYTCQGENVSPPLSWKGVPSATQSLVLINDDPDAPDPKAPKMVWIHWVLYDLPANLDHLPEGAGKVGQKNIERGGVQGMTDFKKLGYGGPCPPIGNHRYFFKLYALDKKLNFPEGKTKADILKAMEGHILAETVLIGMYQKN